MGARLFQKIKYIFQGVTSVIYSKGDICLLCENPEEQDYICEGCRKNIRVLNLKSEIGEDNLKFKCYSIGIYSLNFKKLILSLKYDKDFVAGKILASYLSEYINSNLREKIDLITFIPSTKEAYKSRGFNQCEVLCQYVSESCGIPYMNLMKKQGKSKDQIGLDTSRRWENIKDSFVLKSKSSVINKRILLIDDVITSGATSFYGAKCLKDGGANEVYILTVAKSRV